MPWPHYPNKNVFGDHWNPLYDKSTSFSCDGRLFYSLGPATGNALSPKVLYVRTTMHVQLTVERSCRSWASSCCHQLGTAAKCQTVTDERAWQPWSWCARVLVASVADEASCNEMIKKLKPDPSWPSHLRTTGVWGVTEIWCHTILLAAQHKRAHPTLTPASKAGTQFTYPARRDGRLSRHRCLGYAPAGNRTHDYLIESPASKPLHHQDNPWDDDWLVL